MGSTTSDFFNDFKEKSKIKSYIVTEFFKTYISIISKCDFSSHIYYIDLFSGPGVYNDGNCSTPIKLLDVLNSFEKEDIRNKIKLIFNDENTDYINSLTKNVLSHDVYNKLKYKPEILNLKASEVDLSKYVLNSVPKFSFIDPWGYVDVSAEQIGQLVKSIGSDCVLFFNANRILQDLGKNTSEFHMRKIFGFEYDSAVIAQKNTKMSQQNKSHEFVKLFSKNLYSNYFEPLRKKGYKLFVLPFSFDQDNVEKTSHYIVFISKNHKATCCMKDIMVKKSNTKASLLGYDSKDEYAISFFNREDDVKISLYNIIKDMLKDCEQLFYKQCIIADWLEIIDRYYMKKNYEVTPYTQKELKSSLEELDAQGLLELKMETNSKKRITDNRLIGFNKNILE